MNKRIFSFLLCLLLIVCVTASAEINTDSSWPVTNEEGITIDLAICVNGSDGNVEDMFLFKWLTEASGITVNVTGITKDAWEARKNLIMTSGDLADVYWGFDWSTTDLYYYGSEGDFIALNDLIDQYGSNLNVIDDYIGHDKFLGAATAPDGNIYGIPAMTEPASDMLNRTTYGMSINTVMLEAIGAEIPTNLTELYDVLNQLNEAGYNGTISAQYDSEFRSLTLAAYQIITDGDVTNNIALKQTAEDVWEPIYLAMEPEYREWLLTLNKLYTEGLIDQSFFTTDVVTRAAKNQENLPAVIVSTLDQSLGEDPEQFKQYQVFLLNEDDTLEPITYNVNHTAPGAFVITSECEYPAECPHPYKRFLTLDDIRWAVSTGRFYFIKDTCCDPDMLRDRLDIVRGTQLKLYNANAQTLLASLRQGAAGYSSVMANVHPELYAWLCDHFEQYPEIAEHLQHILCFTSFAESLSYPLVAKYFMRQQGVPVEISSRMREKEAFTPYHAFVMDELAELTKYEYQRLPDVPKHF